MTVEEILDLCNDNPLIGEMVKLYYHKISLMSEFQIAAARDTKLRLIGQCEGVLDGIDVVLCSYFPSLGDYAKRTIKEKLLEFFKPIS